MSVSRLFETYTFLSTRVPFILSNDGYTLWGALDCAVCVYVYLTWRFYLWEAFIQRQKKTTGMWSQIMLWCRLPWSSYPFNVPPCMSTRSPLWHKHPYIGIFKWQAFCFFLLNLFSCLQLDVFWVILCPKAGLAPTCNEYDLTWICRSVRGWVLSASKWNAFKTHLTTPNQILLYKVHLSLHCPHIFTSDLITKGYRIGEWFEVF